MELNECVFLRFFRSSWRRETRLRSVCGCWKVLSSVDLYWFHFERPWQWWNSNKTVEPGLVANDKLKTAKTKEDKGTVEWSDMNKENGRKKHKENGKRRDTKKKKITVVALWAQYGVWVIKSSPQKLLQLLIRISCVFTHNWALHGTIWKLPKACNQFTKERDNTLPKMGLGVYKVGLQVLIWQLKQDNKHWGFWDEVKRSSLKCIKKMLLHKRILTTAGFLVYSTGDSQKRIFTLNYFLASIHLWKIDWSEWFNSTGATVFCYGSKVWCERKQRFWFDVKMLIKWCRVVTNETLSLYSDVVFQSLYGLFSGFMCSLTQRSGCWC